MTRRKIIISSLVAAGLSCAVIVGVFSVSGWFGGGGSVPADTMTRGLVGYWGMDEGDSQTVYDASGNSNNGTLGASGASGTDDPKWTSGAPCLAGASCGGGLSFDGSNDYVNCGAGASLNITSAITIEAWIKVGIAPGSWPSYMNLIGTQNITEGRPYWIMFRGDTKKIDWHWWPTGVLYSLQSTKTDWTAGTWYFITVTFDINGGSNNHKIYINGVLDNQKTSTGAIPHSGTVYIGQTSTGGNYFNGTIDEVRIYNRALSVEEIRYHYNRGGPVAHWKFEEGSGQRVYDSTDNNNDGTLGSSSAEASDDPSWTSGKFGGALSFDGVDDYVNIADNEGLRLNSDFTIEFWMKHISFLYTYPGPLYKGSAGSGYTGFIIFYTADGTIQLKRANLYASSGAGQVTTSWRHYVFTSVRGTSDANSPWRWYIDGVQVSLGNKLWPICEDATSMRLGRADSFGNFLLDEVRIYNYARAPDEVRLDYNAGLSVHFR